ncbi:MAG TPA: VanW family protein [Spirochaetota bacterium]|nr:VanW family protein [Spirochaetota bacterium]
MDGKEVVVSAYATSVNEQPAAVKRNILIASSKLNGIIIRNGEVFSFNKTVGEATVSNGFMPANVLYRDSIVVEVGGGICQVSSTLFNAFLISGFTIVERHRHFQPVSYVPLGLDSTIKYGKKDLRVKNTTGSDIRIHCEINESVFSVKLTSSSYSDEVFEIYTEENEIAPPIEDEQIQNGIEVEVFRRKIIKGKLKETFLLYKDFYPPVKYNN